MPSGTTISVTTTAQAATTVTLPAGNYFATASGGTSSWITALQSALNAGSMGFPTTAAATGYALGYGNFTTGAGWLCNEASGSLVPVFGSPSLTASSSPTYRNSGIKTGDYAVGFDSAADAFKGGAADFDVGATDDLIIAWVAYLSTDLGVGAVNDIVRKLSPPGYRLYMYRNSASSCGIAFNTNDGVDNLFTVTDNASAALNVGAWHVGIAVVDRAANRSRVATYNLSTGVSTVSTATDITAVGSMSNGSNFVVGESTSQPWYLSALYMVKGLNVATNLSANLSTAISNWGNAINSAWTVSMSSTTGLTTINWSGYTGAAYLWSIAWTAANLKTLAGFAADITSVTTAQTGTTCTRGVWIMDCPLLLDGDPTQAPRMTDLRQSESPTGVVLGLVSNYKYRHKNVEWQAVARANVWESAATYDYGSYESFMIDTQFGLGHSWFTPSSRVQIWWDNAGVLTALGSDQSIDGWFVKGVTGVNPSLIASGWSGMYRIVWPELVSDG